MPWQRNCSPTNSGTKSNRSSHQPRPRAAGPQWITAKPFEPSSSLRAPASPGRRGRPRRSASAARAAGGGFATGPRRGSGHVAPPAAQPPRQGRWRQPRSRRGRQPVVRGVKRRSHSGPNPVPVQTGCKRHVLTDADGVPLVAGIFRFLAPRSDDSHVSVSRGRSESPRDRCGYRFRANPLSYYS
jgi:hypothetical protein